MLGGGRGVSCRCSGGGVGSGALNDSWGVGRTPRFVESLLDDNFHVLGVRTILDTVLPASCHFAIQSKRRLRVVAL